MTATPTILLLLFSLIVTVSDHQIKIKLLNCHAFICYENTNFDIFCQAHLFYKNTFSFSIQAVEGYMRLSFIHFLGQNTYLNHFDVLVYALYRQAI